MEFKNITRPGAIALVGSGEYTLAMEETDLALLETIGGPRMGRVVIMATASGLEDPSSPGRWTRMGLEHFNRLGAKVESAGILTREDALDQRWLNSLTGADFYYFSGGNPQHLIGTFQNSPSWDIIRQRWEVGAVLAGCSAGAMALGGYTLNIRAIMQGEAPNLVKALGIIPGFITLPHFDRFGSFARGDFLTDLIQAIPPEITLLGIDEDTSLINSGGLQSGAESLWRVFGRQKVSVFDREGGVQKYGSGEEIYLKAGL